MYLFSIFRTYGFYEIVDMNSNFAFNSFERKKDNGKIQTKNFPFLDTIIFNSFFI